MSTEVKLKNICPVIGIKSSGKSSILNALFNMDYLEVTPNSYSKIVIIIRYNPSLTNPKFYNLFIKKEGNNNFRFYKEKSSEVNGKEKIRYAIKDINEKLKQIEPEFEHIFYLLEIGENNYLEKEFLNNYDLAEIPCYFEIYKNKNDFMKDEKDYFTKIFQILKNKINCGIFVFSVDSFLQETNYAIIKKFKLVLNKPIENFLLLLNQMDKSKNIEEDIISLNQRLIEEFPNGDFNITKNTITPISSFQLENELKMEKSFTNFIYYLYINYYMNPHNYNHFFDFLKNYISLFFSKEMNNIEKEKFIKDIKSVLNDNNILKIKELILRINNNHDTIINKLLLEENDFDEKNIQYCLDDLMVDDEGNINLSEQRNNIIILYLYYLYKNNKVKTYKSSETKKVL